MSKYIDADKLIAEIKQQRSLIEGLFIEGDNSFYEGVDNICCHFLEVINSLQQEQPEPPKIAEYYYHKGVYEGLSQGRADALKILEESMKRKADPVIVIKQQEQQEVDLEKFTEKMDAWKARYNNYPDNIIVKGTMAFTARMFYMYPNVAREWYDSLPKVTLD